MKTIDSLAGIKKELKGDEGIDLAIEGYVAELRALQETRVATAYKLRLIIFLFFAFAGLGTLVFFSASLSGLAGVVLLAVAFVALDE